MVFVTMMTESWNKTVMDFKDKNKKNGATGATLSSNNLKTNNFPVHERDKMELLWHYRSCTEHYLRLNKNSQRGNFHQEPPNSHQEPRGYHHERRSHHHERRSHHHERRSHHHEHRRCISSHPKRTSGAGSVVPK